VIPNAAVRFVTHWYQKAAFQIPEDLDVDFALGVYLNQLTLL
jgi:hypothetical protein